MIRAEYHTLRSRLERMAKSDHFISNQSDKDAIGRAASVIGKLVQVIAQIDREIQFRELHHFEAEQAMTEALAALEPVNGLRPVIAAQGILRAAIAPHNHSTDRVTCPECGGDGVQIDDDPESTRQIVKTCGNCGGTGSSVSSSGGDG